MIEIEAGIDKDRRFNDVVPDGAARQGAVRCGWEQARGWVGQRLVKEVEVSAVLSALVDASHEGLVQVEDVGEVVERRDGRRCQESACHWRHDANLHCIP